MSFWGFCPHCGSTEGHTTGGCPNRPTIGYGNSAADDSPRGWLCPRCYRSNAPAVLVCECSKQHQPWKLPGSL